MASLLGIACSSSDSGTGAADSGTGGDVGAGGDSQVARDTSTADSPAGDSAAMDTGTGDTSMATLDCATYCSRIMTNCTGAALEQFKDMATCTGFCAGYPKGALADMMGNTLGCRIYHAGAAAGSATNATTHCPHAGPTGGDKNPMGTTGVCGEPCDAFCGTAAVVCPNAFASAQACQTACRGFAADTAAYSTADTAKNDMGCRVYHLSAASGSAAAATTHCPHIVAASAVCTM